MTLLAELLRAEASNAERYKLPQHTVALLHRAADALEAGTVVRDVTGKYGYLGRNVRITLMEDDRA